MTRLSLGEEHQCEHCEVIIPPGEIAANVSLDTPHDSPPWLCGSCWGAWEVVRKHAVATAFAGFMRRRMPDPKKLTVLSGLSYEVRACCGLCANGQFRDGSDWGTCRVHTYEHAKHGTRELSIHTAGVCANDFKVSERSKEDLARSGFHVFLERPGDPVEKENA